MQVLNNAECISSPYDGGGGDNEGWVSGCLDIESSKIEPIISIILSEMGDLKNVIENTNRLNLPIVLNPSECTFLDVGLWLHKNERLSVPTIEKHLRYLRFMGNYELAPVDFQHPSYENFRAHMDYREEIEGASPYALKHEWKAMQKYLKACGLQEWPYKPPSQPKHASRDLPFPYTVRQFFHYEYSDDEYETALFQYLFYQSFMVGWRVPSEIIELKTSDVHIDSQGSGSITITEPKKHYSTRTLYPESFILGSRSHKSLKNWLDHWRPKVENSKSDDSLFLQSSGKPFTVRYLGKKLSQYGKLIKPDFRPYDMRHWCAVARLIETKLKNGSFDKFQVQSWLGHEKPRTTEDYIGSALQCFEQYPKSWIHGALRAPYQRGKHHINENRDKALNKSLSGFSPVRGFRTGRAHYRSLEGFRGEIASFCNLCFQTVKSIILNCGFSHVYFFSFFIVSSSWKRLFQKFSYFFNKSYCLFRLPQFHLGRTGFNFPLFSSAEGFNSIQPKDSFFFPGPSSTFLLKSGGGSA